MKTALILIDLQNDYFQGGKWPLDGMEAASENATKLLSLFREKKHLVYHVQHINNSPEAPLFVAGTQGADIHNSVEPLAYERIVVKAFPNSFLQTTLLADLQSAGIQRLVICGAMSNMCIDATTRAGADLGFNCIVAHDACAAKTLEFSGRTIASTDVHGSFMAALSLAYAKVITTDEVIQLINE